MADYIQKYRRSPLNKVKQYLARRETTYITLPGHPFPIAVHVPRRQWPWVVSMVGVALGTAFVVTRLLTATPAVPVPFRPPTVAGCVPDDVRLIFSKIKDRVRVYIDDAFFRELRSGEVVNFDGSVERRIDGAGWGDLNLNPHLSSGSHTFRFEAFHDKGENAGAMIDIRQNAKTMNVLAIPFGLHHRWGKYAVRIVSLTINMCDEEHRDERGSTER
jgi:hypothetical protein